MDQPIIEVKNISKKYILAHQVPYQTIRDTVVELAKKPFQLFRSKIKNTQEEFWALKDVSFAVQQGEAIGLIGANGSGKSTLLKLISQITHPTEGEIILRGEVASLLEIGTGFHPELTGRENIFLNGAILGMKKKEITRKFDDIVKFSGVEKFLDTPVKRYSSGMHVRLAFAVAAHMEPDILIVDEVLAVGDVDFQKKSLGKMDAITKDAGRTIIFVSHNMEAIQRLCTRCILLKEGRIEMFDQTEKVIEHYLHRTNQPSGISLRERKDRSGKGGITFTDIEVTNTKDEKILQSGDRLRIRMKYESAQTDPIKDVRVVVTIVNENLQPVLRLDSNVTDDSFTNDLPPKGEVLCETAEVNLIEGRYFANIDFLTRDVSHDCVLMATDFQINLNLKGYNYKARPDTADYLISYSFKS